VDHLSFGWAVVGVSGMTASAESVVIKVEILAIEARNLFSLTGFGKVKPSPSMISVAFEPNELVVCHDSRIGRLWLGFSCLVSAGDPTIWQLLFIFLPIVEALGLRITEAVRTSDDFESISRSSGNTSNTELERSFECCGL